jgi:hypothetical protein
MKKILQKKIATFILKTCFLLLILTTTKVSADTKQNIFIDKTIENIDLKTIKENKSVFQLISHGRSGELFINGQWKNAPEIANYLTTHYSLLNI